ncbi:hypothetical protein BCR32DRAFT_286358 [Anaeromyces robustus]|uniref:ATP-dependent helicase Rep n=1 Tax=Anaeromyces robustus TaxID=1754192 RepID=A0A1Y1VXT1_9FUNG|nr:hypothetical protein BCR32DRAFT_286358 [Anaeromyces robustus]|eukprot:ORX66090.1 hypothetical protein BCR32DRAFT_286358 [Anaeromyces robustus]
MSRYFAFTLNSYSEDDELALQTFAKNPRVMHLLYGKEVAPTTGTNHLQGCFCLVKKTKLLTIKNFIGLRQLHIEPCKKVYEANLKYCQKSGLVWQWPLEFIREEKNDNKQTYAQAIELAKQGRFNEIAADKLLKYDNKFKKIYAETVANVETLYFNNKFGDFFKDFNIFIYGPTGTGKSFRIDQIIYILNEFWKIYCKNTHKEYHPFRSYKKNRNKWWDDYMGEEICIIEELEPNWCQMAASNLKTWFDQYSFPGEIKGSSISKIRPLFWILTSNYSLEQLFTNKDGKLIEEDYKPLKRRLYIVKTNNIHDDINWPKLDRIAYYFDTIENVKFEINSQYKNIFDKYMRSYNIYKQNIIENENNPLFNTYNEISSIECEQGSEPRVLLTDEESTNEPILLDTIDDEGTSTENDWPLCKICCQNDIANSYEERCEECINKGLVYRPDIEPAYKNNEYFDQLLESAYKVQDAHKQQKKFNSQIYHVNIVTDFIWDKPEENNELNMYKIMIKDFNLKIKNSRRKISAIQKELSKLRLHSNILSI